MTDEHAPCQLNTDQLTPWQRAVVDNPSRYLIVQGGSACGKTHAVLAAIVKQALAHPGCTCVYSSYGLHLRSAQAGLLGILAGQPDAGGLVSSISTNPPVVYLVNGSQICFIQYDQVREQTMGRDITYAAADMDNPVDIRPLSTHFGCRVAMTIGGHWGIVRADIPQRSWIESVQASPDGLYRRMLEGDWSGAEEKGPP